MFFEWESFYDDFEPEKTACFIDLIWKLNGYNIIMLTEAYIEQNAENRRALKVFGSLSSLESISRESSKRWTLTFIILL